MTELRTVNGIVTPCVQVCVREAQSGLCYGCGRSGAEIAGWLDMTPRERETVIAQLPPRVAELKARLRAALGKPAPDNASG